METELSMTEGQKTEQGKTQNEAAVIEEDSSAVNVEALTAQTKLERLNLDMFHSADDKFSHAVFYGGIVYEDYHGTLNMAASGRAIIPIAPTFQMDNDLTFREDGCFSRLDQLTMNAYCSIFAENPGKPLTAYSIFRSMRGRQTNDLSPSLRNSIEASLEMWNSLLITVDITEESLAWNFPLPGKGIRAGFISEHALEFTTTTMVREDGTTEKVYWPLKEPILLMHARLKRQVLIVPQADLLTPGRWSQEQRAVSEYIARQVARIRWKYEDRVNDAIRRKRTRSLPREGEQMLTEAERKITIATLADRTGLNYSNGKTDADRRQGLRIRAMMEKSLDVLSSMPNSGYHVAIMGYHFSTAERSRRIDGAVIDLYPPAPLVQIWERRQKDKERRIKREREKNKSK